ncbi:GNAT family N-acetyltransferase [Paenibacillus glacialis]|uniref:Acetyltransferase n=1 Tax=Paenibacillus glacialis TaxID=494026 RepID=A0A162LU80_9BACL|nr:GNAT family protein [Paenibacillus glacialis]OAB39827.1 acetyltransferase [Paenibacillus glacialis]
MYVCDGNIPKLESDRILLRRMEPNDAPKLFECWSRSEVREHSGIPELESLSSAVEMIQFLNALSETEDGLRWGIVKKESNEWIGSCGFNMWQLEGAYRGEIGCELSSLYWGQGYMSEAIQLLLNYGFQVMGLHRIEVLVDPRNERASRLFIAQQFQMEGKLRDYRHTTEGFHDVHIYSVLHGDWLQKQKEMPL